MWCWKAPVLLIFLLMWIWRFFWGGYIYSFIKLTVLFKPSEQKSAVMAWLHVSASSYCHCHGYRSIINYDCYLLYTTSMLCHHSRYVFDFHFEFFIHSNTHQTYVFSSMFKMGLLGFFFLNFLLWFPAEASRSLQPHAACSEVHWAAQIWAQCVDVGLRSESGSVTGDKDPAGTSPDRPQFSGDFCLLTATIFLCGICCIFTSESLI